MQLVSRDAENPMFKGLGLKEYYWTQSVLRKSTGMSQLASVKQEGSLTKSEYDEVSAAMRTLPDSQPKPRKGGKKAEKPAETPEMKQRKEALSLKATALRKLKSCADRVRAGIKDAMDLLPQIAARGYPPEMGNFYRTKFTVVEGMVDSSLKLYGEMIIKADDGDTECITSERENTKKCTTELDAAFAKLKKDSMVDLKSLAK